MKNRMLTAALLGTLIGGLACEQLEPFSPTSADRPRFGGRGSGGVVVGTVDELVDAMASAAATGWPQEIEIKAGHYPLSEPLPRIQGGLRIEGEGEETVIDGAALPAFGISPGAFSQRAIFDIVGGDVVIEKLVVQNGDVGIRVTDGTVIEPGTAAESHCVKLNTSYAHDVQNVRIEAVRFYNFFEALRATTHGIASSLTGLDLSDLYFDGNVEGVVISNDCFASGSVIDFVAKGIIVRNTRPEPPAGAFDLTGVGLSAGNFGQSANGTVTGKVKGVTVENDGPPSGASVVFCGGCFGAFAGTTNIDVTNLTINNAVFGLQLFGGIASWGASVLSATASDVTANTADAGLSVVAGILASNSHTDAVVSDIDLRGVAGSSVGVVISAGLAAGNSVVVALSDARIDHFEGAFVSQSFGGGAGGNSVHATFTDAFHCGDGPAGQFFHFGDGNASLTVDSHPEPGPLFDLPPCGG